MIDNGEPLADESAERALIGSAIIEEGSINAVAELVTADDFCNVHHAAIWRAMLVVHHEGSAVDAITIAAELKTAGQLEQVGGASYLDGIIDSTPALAHPEPYAKLVSLAAWRRRVRSVSERTHRVVSDPTATREDIENQIARLQRATDDTVDEIPSMTSVELDAKIWPAPSGWLVHDWLLSNACFLVAGHPKSAKSIIAAALCLAVASGEDFLRRWPVTRSGPAIFINGEDGEQLTQPRLRKLAATLGIAYPLSNLIVSCQQECDISTARGWAKIAALVRRVRPVITVVDCFRRFAPRANENNSAEVSPILCRARGLQKETGTAFGFVHHLSRDNEWNKGTPPIQRLRGSGEFYAWLDSGIGMERPDRKKPEHYMTATHRGAGDPDEQTVFIGWDDERNEVNIHIGEPRSKKERQRSFRQEREAFG